MYGLFEVLVPYILYSYIAAFTHVFVLLLGFEYRAYWSYWFAPRRPSRGIEHALLCTFNTPTSHQEWVWEREALVDGDLPRQHPLGTTLRFTGPVPADSRQ